LRQHLTGNLSTGAGLMSSRAPIIPSNCEPEWAHLLERCWEPVPQNRCSLRDLSESLQRIIDEIDVEQQVQPCLHLMPSGLPATLAASLSSSLYPQGFHFAQMTFLFVGCCSLTTHDCSYLTHEIFSIKKPVVRV